MTDGLEKRDEAPIQIPTERGLFDPPFALQVLRETEPVRRLWFPWGDVGWLVTSYPLARAVLGDLRFGKFPDDPQLHENPKVSAVMRQMGADDPAVRALVAGSFLMMDPPEHTRFRRVLAPFFTMGRLREDLQGQIEVVVEELTAEIARIGPPLDFVAHFAEQLPPRAICSLLGIPQTEHQLIQDFAFNLLDATDDEEEVEAAVRSTAGMLRVLLAERKADLGDDLVSSLVQGGFSDDEIIGIGMVLAAAGVHTTSSTLGLGLFALLAERRSWELLVSDGTLVESASEELLRYLTVNQLDAHTRTALEDIELGGVKIGKGERVQVSLPAANRDPAKFQNPDSLDVGRDARGHLTLGHGVHVCLGQHLARLEMHIAFSSLATRFPGLRLGVPAAEIPLTAGSAPLYRPLELPVTW